jgi:outer membrane protein assembly factor BamA
MLRRTLAPAAALVPLAVLGALVLTATSAQAFDFPPKRRKDQRQTTPGYILTPAAANIPGIGFTYGLLGSYFNLASTEADVIGFKFFGDLAGAGVGSTDIPLFTDDLTLNAFWSEFSRAAIESNRRGIDGSRDDRKIVELDSFGVQLGQLNWRLFERRLQLLAGMNQQFARTGGVRDKDGGLIAAGNGQKQRVTSRSAGAFLDLADDRSDPREGVQLETYRYDRPTTDRKSADFYTMEYNATAYVPVLSYSTWVFNVYRADAVVTREGDTDEAHIREDLGFDCDAGSDADQRDRCNETEATFVKEERAARRFGTAPALGGTQRLRSYVTNRFAAAHAMAAGTEFRYNLTDEFTPFNIFVAGGVRTGIQVAAFGEGGTVSDYQSELFRHWRYSYGTGLRFILASGFVVRLDLARGDEGTQPTLIFQYPWSVF